MNKSSGVLHPKELAAIASTLSDAGLLDRVRAVAGRDVGDPLNNPQDSVKLREQFSLTVEFTHRSVFAFNDYGVCAALPTMFPDAPSWARRAACVAVASMWTPAIGKAARILTNAPRGVGIPAEGQQHG